MNQTVDIAADLAAKPPPELENLLNDPRTTDSARQAVSELVKSPAGESANGHVSATKSNGTGDGRLQIVNEKQDFTYVTYNFGNKGSELTCGVQQRPVELSCQVEYARQRLRIRRSLGLWIPIHRKINIAKSTIRHKFRRHGRIATAANY